MRSVTRFVTCTIVIGWISWIHTVESSCTINKRELYAYSNPATEIFRDSFTKYISSDKGATCRWIIKSSDDEEVVKLSFPIFELQNTTGSDKGDCVSVYDVLSKAKIIRIAGIVGAALAVIGLTYVVFRATKCCSCLRGKNSRGTDNLRSSTRERDRLTRVVVEEADNEDNSQNTTNQNQSQNLTSPSNNGGVSPSPSHNSATANDAAQESDTDSLQDMNEPPPSYESLYLNEQGEAVTPPRYSPPKHHTTHPPRRVHTIN